MKKIIFLLCAFLPTICLAKDNFDMNLEHRISNLETENSYLKQKIQNQEATIDSVREEMSALVRATKDSSDKCADEKLVKLEKNIEKLIADMKQFKTHANETSDTITAQGKSLKDFEEMSASSKKQLKEFEEALKSLAKAMSISSSGTPSTAVTTTKGTTYKVHSGDSLGKIAKNFGKSISVLREVNRLKSDTIVPGQELVIPD